MQNAEKNYVVYVTDFGADPTGQTDSAEAVIRAMEQAKKIRREDPEGRITLDFPRGTYQFYPDKAEERELYVSNTVGADQEYKYKKIGILVEDINHLTVEGNESQFIFHGQMTVFAAIRSEDVEFRNFTEDFQVPTAVDITVESVEENMAVVYIPECYDYAVENGELHWYGERSPYTGEVYWTGINLFKYNYPQSNNRITKITVRENHLFDDYMGIEDLGNHRVRFSYEKKHESVQPGMCYQMRLTIRDTPGAFFWMSKDIRMINLNLRYLHGFGVLGQTSENITLDHVSFRAPEETGRTTAGYADFIQMSGCKGKIKIENCYFANAHDDPINIHGTFQQVVAISDDRREIRVRYMHNETAGFPSFAPGDEVEFTSRSTMLPVENAIGVVEKIISSPTGDSSEVESLTDTVIRLENPVPEEVEADTYVVENITFTPEVEVRNCEFRELPTRGVLVTTRKPVIIENNAFYKLGMAPVYISCDANNWYESGRVEDVVIRNNRFYNCQGNGVIFIEPIITESAEERTVHKNIRIEKNSFYLNQNHAVDASSVDGLQIIDNEIHYSQKDQELYVMRACKNVQIENNREYLEE